MEERTHGDVQPQQWPAEAADGAEAVPASAAPAAAPWWRQPGPAILLGALIIAAGIGTGIALTGSSGSAPAAPPNSPSAAPGINVHGTITLPFLGTDLLVPNARDTEVSATQAPSLGDACEALGGFSDISAGTAVTIGGATGQTLGIGSLGAGTVSGQPGQPASCAFAFNVEVPGGQSLYTVTISHRGTQTFTPDQVAAGVELMLGQ